jgi:radical SAM-linked protein
MERVRIFYSKTEPMRYTGNLDVHKVWERTIRRAQLPLAYSHGFHPQPRINQACPLPLGLLSKAEAIDIWLDEDLSMDHVREKLSPALPPGLTVEDLKVVDSSEPSLPTQVKASDFIAIVLSDIPPVDIQARITQFLQLSSLVRERRGKCYDLRPLVEGLELQPQESDARPTIFMRLSAREGATGRPDEVLDAMGIGITDARVVRIALVYHPKTPVSALSAI